MSQIKITNLAPITTVSTSDPLAIVDLSDTSQASSGTTKKITVNQLATVIAASTSSIFTGSYSDPNGNVTAVPGSIYFDLSTPTSPVQWIKTTGSGNTGWI